MTKEEAYHYIDNLKWLKGYDNTVIGGKTVGEILDEINALLKEREPVEPLIDVDTYVCPNCGHRLEHQSMLGDNVIFDERYNFCPACGKAVKWDAD